MSLTKQETEWLKSAAENSAANKQLLTTHTEQITLLFEQQRVHQDNLTVLITKQDLADQKANPGNKAERTAVWVAVVFGVAGFLWQLFNCLK